MSESAKAYYQERAARLGIEEIPAVLSGRPVLLLSDEHDQRLSLHNPNPVRLQEVTDRYAELLKSVGNFVVDAYLRTHPEFDGQVEISRHHGKVNKNHIDSVIEKKLFPGYVKAGHIKDIRLEAIARSEVLPTHLRVAGESSGYFSDEEKEDSEVYLLLTGALYAGRMLGYAACLTIVAATWQWGRGSNPTWLNPKYMGVAYKKNDLLAKSGLEQSRATANYIDMWGLANPTVQNVRRGKRDHGSRKD